MVDVGFTEDGISRAYDILNLFIILLNLLVSIALTFSEIRVVYGDLCIAIEEVTIAFFALDYILRLWTSDRLYPGISKPAALTKLPSPSSTNSSYTSFLFMVLRLTVPGVPPGPPFFRYCPSS